MARVAGGGPRGGGGGHRGFGRVTSRVVGTRNSRSKGARFRRELKPRVRMESGAYATPGGVYAVTVLSYSVTFNNPNS